jgi:hypothetical protein
MKSTRDYSGSPLDTRSLILTDMVIFPSLPVVDGHQLVIRIDNAERGMEGQNRGKRVIICDAYI